MVNCELPNTPKAPSSACSSLLVLNFDGILVLSARTQTPSLSLCHQFCSCKKGPGLSLLVKSFVATHICPEPRSKQFLLYCSVQSHSFSIFQLDLNHLKSEPVDRLDGCTWCFLSCAKVLGSRQTQRRTKLSRIATHFVRDQLPAGELICDYGMSATWHECTAKPTKIIGISWQTVKTCF